MQSTGFAHETKRRFVQRTRCDLQTNNTTSNEPGAAAKNQTKTINGIYNFLKSNGFDPILKSTNGKEVSIPEEAEVIQFTFKDPPVGEPESRTPHLLFKYLGTKPKTQLDKAFVDKLSMKIRIRLRIKLIKPKADAEPEVTHLNLSTKPIRANRLDHGKVIKQSLMEIEKLFDDIGNRLNASGWIIDNCIFSN